MTSTTATNEVLKQDRRGRVRVPKERREALLEEFGRSGLSAAAFAQMVGIKYPTFANWLQQRRKAQHPSAAAPPEVVARGGAIRLLEAVVEDHAGRAGGSGAGLLIELPGGGRLTVPSPAHLAMAAELLALLAQRSRGC
jgi:transposase-like protein